MPSDRLSPLLQERAGQQYPVCRVLPWVLFAACVSVLPAAARISRGLAIRAAQHARREMQEWFGQIIHAADALGEGRDLTASPGRLRDATLPKHPRFPDCTGQRPARNRGADPR